MRHRSKGRHRRLRRCDGSCTNTTLLKFLSAADTTWAEQSRQVACKFATALWGSADRHHRDFQPNVHDSNVLLMQTGAENWIARPLSNLQTLRHWLAARTTDCAAPSAPMQTRILSALGQAPSMAFCQRYSTIWSSTRSAVRRSASSRSAVRFPILKKLSAARCAFSGR